MDTSAQAISQFRKVQSPFWKLYISGKSIPFVTRTLENDKFSDSLEQLEETISGLNNGSYMLRIRRAFQDSGDKDKVEFPFIKSDLVSLNSKSSAFDEATIRAEIEAKIRKEMEEKAWRDDLTKRIEALEEQMSENDELDRRLENSIEQVSKVIGTLPKLKSSFASLKTLQQ